MGWKEELQNAAHKGSEFLKTDGVKIFHTVNLQGLHKKVEEFDYEDVQGWGLGHINDYVDGLHPNISTFLAKEVTKLEMMLLDSLEGHVVSVFDTTFKDRKPGDLFQDKQSLKEYTKERSEPKKEAPSKYGEAGNPFHNAVQKKSGFKGAMSGFKKFMEEHGEETFEKAKEAMHDVGDTIEDHADKFGRALDKVKDAALEGLSELLGKIVRALKGIMDNIREKAIELVHWLREVVGDLLRDLNRGLAAAFTTAALTCLKTFLRENTELEDLKRAATKTGDDIRQSALSLVQGFSDMRTSSSSSLKRDAKEATGGHEPPRNEDAVAAVDRSGGNALEAGVASVLSGKLSNGYARVREETREEFRSILSVLETLLLDKLPHIIQSPLTRLFDGDPLTVGEQRDEKSGNFLKDLFHDLVENIQQIAHDILMAIKNKIFAVAAGSYEVLERVAWKYVQETTVAKMKVYLPSLDVKNLDEDAY